MRKLFAILLILALVFSMVGVALFMTDAEVSALPGDWCSEWGQYQHQSGHMTTICTFAS